jgi:hypothetical protein
LGTLTALSCQEHIRTCRCVEESMLSKQIHHLGMSRRAYLASKSITDVSRSLASRSISLLQLAEEIMHRQQADSNCRKHSLEMYIDRQRQRQINKANVLQL